MKRDLIALLLFLAALLPGNGEVHQAYVGPGAGFALLGSFLTMLAGTVLGAFSLLAWPFRLAWRTFRRWRAGRKAHVRKAIFLGLDGFDPQLTDQFLERGLLPNLRKLAAMGSYQRLRTTLPALSPVAWSTFATGVNPARHNIFDFLNREAHSYLPELSSCKVHPPRKTLRIGSYRIPIRGAWVEARRKSKAFWTILGEHQISSTIVRVPITFPPEKFNGRLLSAMSTPDLRGTQGTFTFFSTRPGHGPLVRSGDLWTGDIEGPANPVRADAAAVRLPFTLEPHGDQSATLRVNGETHRLRAGEYSVWISLPFHCAPTVRVNGIGRFLLTEADEHHSLYLTPINIDPENPALPISHPRYYASYLAHKLGRFATVGMAEDTSALNEEVIDEQAFLRQAYDTFVEREAMFQNALERTRHGVVACVFDTPDRVQHMFFRNPAAIEDLYQRMDALVGRAMQYIDEHTAFFVLSDHGFTAVDRGVNLNTWLLQNGYLALKPGSKENSFLRSIDWSRTRAYALGLGGLYLNRKGREPQGVVSPSEAEGLKRELAQKLSALKDDETAAVRQVYITSNEYRGPYLDAAPDLVVGFAAGYRISWSAAKGEVTGEVFETNDKHWCGDHCVDPELVPGVLFSNRKVTRTDAGIEDMAPTALTLFGVAPPVWMEGTPLLADGRA